MVNFQSATNTKEMLYLSILAAMAMVVLFAPTPSQSVPLIGGGQNIEYKRYCSNTLSDAIRLICGGRYNSLARKYPGSVVSGSYRSNPLKRFAPDDGVFYRPSQSGPVHECCRRPCGYSELKMYCAPD